MALLDSIETVIRTGVNCEDRASNIALDVLNVIWNNIDELKHYADKLLLKEDERLSTLVFPRCYHNYWLPDTDTCDGCGMIRTELECDDGA